MKAYVKQTTKIFPEDAKFREALIQNALYSKTSGLNDRVKLLLESIEATLTKERVNFENLNLEHVMPQKLNQQWQADLGANYSKIRKEWLHKLGNLTLTGYNPNLSNKSFAEKRSLLNSSNITLNQYFRNIITWNEEAIKKRAEHLADIALNIWSR